MMYESNIKSDKPAFKDISPVVRFANYFEVADGAYWGWRVIPDYELILIVEGNFEYKTEKLEIVAGKGDIICIQPMERHYFCHRAGSGKGVISCIHSEPFDCSRAERSCEPALRPQAVTHPQDGDFFHSLFLAASQNILLAGDYGEQLLRNIVKVIWLALIKYWVELPTAPSASTLTGRMCNYIKSNTQKKLSRNDLAGVFGYTPEYINYLFKKELNLTPSQYIYREKILYAFMLIHQNGMSVKQAALRVGFEDQYHFSKLFKKIIGRSPSEYKR